MTSAFSKENDTYVQLAGYYITARLFMSIWAGLTACMVSVIRGLMLSQILQYLAGVALWIGSTQFASPQSLGLVITALIVDICGSSMYYITLFRWACSHTSPMANRIDRFYEFCPATNIEHKVEGTNAFVCLVIGYGVVGVFYQNQCYGLDA